MRSTTIQTGPGKYREVYIVSGAERRAYVRLARRLAEYERELAASKGVADVAHGFVAGRSPVTMARAHIGYDVTLSLDLADWFESVDPMHLREAGVGLERVGKCCIGGKLRQGLPTSPAAANIAAVQLDEWISDGAAGEVGLGYCYTRYADDLTISWLGGSGVQADAVVRWISDLAKMMRWRINEAKTRIQYASAGRRIICGLSVGETDVRATRAVRHRLRACQHARPGTSETRGLGEWAACKLPGSRAAGALINRVLSREG